MFDIGFTDDVDDREAVVIINIKKTKTGGEKCCSIVEENDMNTLQLYRKYTALRPKELQKRPFLVLSK